MNNYAEFIKNKSQSYVDDGFDPVVNHDWLFPFQHYLCEWALRKGRSAIFADCGMGKTPMQLSWADNVLRFTNKPVLIVTPLAVSYQTCDEATKFGIDTTHCRDGQHQGGIVVTNYERLHYFDSSDFAGMVCDESSILKNFAGSTKAAVTEFLRTIPYRLLCTATAAPNDFFELGTSSEALGYLGYQDMLSRFFKEDTIKDYLGWGRKSYRFRGHAEDPFWRWVCSWSRACRKPSDIGFDDNGFVLPELVEREYVAQCDETRDGLLFAMPARTLPEQRAERRMTIPRRCEVVADLAAEATLDDPSNGSAVMWCHLNDEATMLENIIPDAVQVSGSMPEEQKEERLLAFQRGEIKKLVTKPKIGCYGLNWQHCHTVFTFASHSWEQYYQSVRRCWRFGQTNPVTVTVVTSEGEDNVLKNMQRKAFQSERMFESLVSHSQNALTIDKDRLFNTVERVPSWLATTK